MNAILYVRPSRLMPSASAGVGAVRKSAPPAL